VLETGTGTSPQWPKLTFGAAAGAVAAVILGYALSAALSMLGLAFIGTTEEVRETSAQAFIRWGLNYYAIHHIQIVGKGVSEAMGNTQVSVFWPVTIWAAVPAVTAILGGLISSKLSRSEGTSRFAVSALFAIIYAAILVTVRMLISVPSANIGFPQFEIEGWSPTLGALPTKLVPDFASTLLHGLMFGLIFGGIGAFGGPVRAWHGMFRRDSFWPAWMRGALFSLIISYVVFLLILAAFAGISLGRGSGEDEGSEQITASTAATLLPTAAGLVHYFSHGVTLNGEAGTTPAIDDGFRFRSGLLSGRVEDDKRSPVPGWAYILLLIPAAAMVAGGYVTAKTVKGPLNRLALAAGFAGTYALMFTALTPFFTLVQASKVTVGDITTQSSVLIGPSAAQAFPISLVLAFVFGIIGISIYRPHVR